MTTDRKHRPANSIPIRFADDDIRVSDEEEEVEGMTSHDDLNDSPSVGDTQTSEGAVGGPELAELVASRAELKRLQTALAEAQEAVARRQADFENYRKRVERDRTETHNRIVADVARKLL